MGEKAVNQFLLFQRLRGRLLDNSLRGLVRGSGLQLITVLVCSALIWGALFVVSREGFQYSFLQYKRMYLIVGILFDLLFLSLAALLVFSTCLILYGSLFHSAEAAFLMAHPVKADHIFAYKFQTALGFSSWAFVLLGSPFMLAFGLVVGAPWTFYVLLPAYFLGFVLLPGSLAAVLTVLVANWFPRRPRQVVLASLGVGAFAAAVWGYQVMISVQDSLESRSALERLLAHVTFARGVLAPNYWMARGLLAASRGQLGEAVYGLALLWGNGLFAYLVAAWMAARLYRRGYNRVATGDVRRRRQGGLWLDRLLEKLLGGLQPQTRLLILKDFRTFRRDPAQWGQVVIFTALLVFYFLNVRRFYGEEVGEIYQNGISMLNLTATALLLCAYTGRFIFPLLSLEGRKFWILGLLPLSRERLLWGKFLFSAAGGLVIAGPLIGLSDSMLGMSAATMLLHGLTVAVLAIGLSGLSVGLGAVLANFRETDPSKIAAGFGGTLNLVSSLLFLSLVLGLMAVPWHLLAAANVALSPLRLAWLTGGFTAGIGLGAAAVIVPLRLGGQRLRRMDF
jgi:ABC-2 type transport system permease protein